MLAKKPLQRLEPIDWRGEFWHICSESIKFGACGAIGMVCKDALEQDPNTLPMYGLYFGFTVVIAFVLITLWRLWERFKEWCEVRTGKQWDPFGFKREDP